MGYTIWPDGDTGDVLSEVNAERRRQDRLKQEGKFLWTCADKTQSNERKLTVLTEEVGEAAREVCDAMIAFDKERTEDAMVHIRNLRKELIQIAAVAVAWAESLPFR